ncbi:transcriptional regulator GcvA [Herbaspirillum robiniae]|uniref:Transcriptional regulator GcvA n=1 Tax=Herbaspirillum robiniae TaxID=2014887 RepID=A0ABX2M389_9BURK|nr:transcriptional regulator GcvA [Herbaspirillum robiniae]NUU02716.1 transcriptional regulator GcvA [Herbaspirillum robiniae]
MAARKLPSLHALRAFEAAARHCSFTLAAQELHVTQGAVSHQIKALEDELGRALFERLPNQLRLTRPGHDYLTALSEAFDRIERATAQLDAVALGQRLAISSSPNFSAKWLVPRLGDFTRRHPGLELRLEQSEGHVNFVREDIDAAIRYGIGPWPGLTCLRLADEFLLPVCAPSLADVPAAQRPAGLTLLHLDDRQAWTDWLAEHDRAASNMARMPGIVFNHESAVIDAAVAGQGVALARWSLVAQALREGKLTAPFPPGAQLEQAYWLVCPEAREHDDNITLFLLWLQQSFDDDRRLREALTAT